MSGSSLDGLDIAFVEFDESGGKWNYDIKASVCMPYETEWSERLANACNLTAFDYLMLHVAYGKYIGDKINEFIEAHQLHHQVQLIASHGHTGFHNPAKGMSAQIGDGSVIAASTGINVVSDLRAIDIAFGGQGAPIVPIGEKLLLNEYSCFLMLDLFGNRDTNVVSLRNGFRVRNTYGNRSFNVFRERYLDLELLVNHFRVRNIDNIRLLNCFGVWYADLELSVNHFRVRNVDNKAPRDCFCIRNIHGAILRDLFRVRDANRKGFGPSLLLWNHHCASLVLLNWNLDIDGDVASSRFWTATSAVHSPHFCDHLVFVDGSSLILNRGTTTTAAGTGNLATSVRRVGLSNRCCDGATNGNQQSQFSNRHK